VARAVKSAADRIALVADEGSFEPWDQDVVSTDPLDFTDSKPYTERLAAAREATGSSESVETGRATVGGRSVALVASDFGFLAGSIGAATSERIARAFDRARAEGVPLIAIPASGGTRMQEGSLGLTGMAKLAAAARRLRSAGLPYIVYLTHPTTGGVMASWASLASVTFAQPGALTGFGGPRVVELMTGTPLPEGVQTSDNLYAHGLVDDLVEPADLRERVERVLAVTTDVLPPAPAREAPAEATSSTAPAAIDPWASLTLARDPNRPTARDFLDASATDVTELRGDGDGTDDPACLVALARVRGIPAMVVAQNRDRTSQTPARMSPAGYRKARRALGVAGELGLPVLTFVDTPGAEMSVAAEEGGLSRSIAYMLAEMSTVETPTLAVLLGEGGSGGALALLPGDRVVSAEHASLSAIAPEGASAILYRTTDRAPELAATQGIASSDLLRFGIVDRIVDERPSADQERDAFLSRLGDVVEEELRGLLNQDPLARLDARERRYRTIGDLTQGGTR
jgi:acetyl-CoA carboxylase carboxyl transferase beta subunit/acetyl-CoA carboxylase carboxyl transferase alpha subunit